MGLRRILFLCALCLLPLKGAAEDGPVRLYAPPALADTGVFRYILPRFSLKTQVRVTLVADRADAQVVLGDEGRALFEGAGAVWRLAVPGEGAEDAGRLANWLASDVGLRTVTGFAPDGVALFALPEVAEAEPEAVVIDGDAALGLDVSRRACARCHGVEPDRSGGGIGSTPSFRVLRALPDWEERFGAFYVLNPDPAFTQITDVTEPFPIERPSPISPVEMSIDELEAVMAYVWGLSPADLGAPLRAQDF